jgi:hypothetical protein
VHRTIFCIHVCRDIGVISLAITHHAMLPLEAVRAVPRN